MAAAVDHPVRDLSVARCRDLLLGSSHGFLACTRFALPLIVPVEIDCFEGEVLVLVHDRRLCGPLDGHVVALTVGVHARPPAHGWTVVACGRFGATTGDGSTGHPLDVRTLQGWTFEGAGGPRAALPDPVLVLAQDR